MFVWQKRASVAWLAANERELNEKAGQHLAIIYRPAQKTALAQVTDKSRGRLERLSQRFGGRIEALPSDWLKKTQEASAISPLRIGRRLTVVGEKQRRTTSDRTLLIPAGAAFGTGGHVTTAMSLRLLEQISRGWKPGWSLLDYGTGTGILALAAKRFGAAIVIGIDLDSTAVSMARQNAGLNKIRGVDFRACDVRRARVEGHFDVITANIFAELLIEITLQIARRLKRGGFAILSGILRHQECDVARALPASDFLVRMARRRGKWVALLAQKRI